MMPKPWLCPQTRIQEHDDRKWLQLRPTSQPLNQIIFGKEAIKNASFSNHPSFQGLFTKRNKIWTQADEANQDHMVEEEHQIVKPKKRKVEGAPEVKEVPVGDATIACLMQVPLEEVQLKPIFLLLHQDQDKESLRHKKAYNKSKTQAVPAESEEPKA